MAQLLSYAFYKVGINCERRTALGGKRRAQSWVLKDVLNDSRILDQRNDPHRPLALGALQRIDRAQAAVARAANSFVGSSPSEGRGMPAWGEAFFARSPRSRFEYHRTLRSRCSYPSGMCRQRSGPATPLSLNMSVLAGVMLMNFLHPDSVYLSRLHV